MPRNDVCFIFGKADEAWDAGNVKQAFKLFSAAAEQGDLSSLHNVAYFYDVGIYVSKNKKKALQLYKQAARQGNVSSMTNIGTLYRDWGNFRRAHFWFLRAFKSGDGDAALDLAKLHLKRNARGDITHALKYLHLAVGSKFITEQSIEEATIYLKKLDA